ncbi:MAG: hypothetical protein PHV03_05980 [Desulfitobacteriaceae bacterium]|nr:hypothetical protein [Desulfitobacteriaceae bacterium]
MKKPGGVVSRLKKAFSYTLSFMFMCGLLFGGIWADSAFASDVVPLSWEGVGTAANPYQISSPEHLDGMREKMAENGGTVHFIQTEDIDLSGYDNWTPIGDNTNPFKGTYDGNGKSIYNLNINDDTSNYVGLFGYVGASGTLKDIKLENVNSSSAKRDPNVGLGVKIGGLVGQLDGGTISGSSVSGNVSGSELYAEAGGLAGHSDNGTISDSHNAASVNGEYAGGLIGRTQTGSINVVNSYNIGAISGCYVGGIVGYTYQGPVTITDSCNQGTVLARTDNAIAGGLTGHCYQGSVTINSSYNEGTVTSDKRAGGLAGHMYSGVITNSYNTGTVSGTNYVGGLVSFIDTAGEIINSYSTGSIEGGTTTGGLVGQGGTVTNSYYDQDTSDQSDTGKGIPLTTAEMKAQASFAGWDFTQVWKIAEDISYPTLRWQPWTDDETIFADAYALTWNTIKGENTDQDNIEKDLELPTTGAQGSTITWSTDHPNLINTDTGVVTMPDGDTAITLTATVSLGEGMSVQKDFNLLIIGIFKGEGSEATPYQVENAVQLAEIGYLLNSEDIHFIQAEDIDLIGYENWIPIGDSSNPFEGTYNGNGKTIFNLTIDDNTLTDVGLFSFVGSSGKLENITLENVSIDSSKEDAHVGGLVGTNHGAVSGCSSAGNVFANADNTLTAYVGGLVGLNISGGVVTNSSSSGSVKSNRSNGSAGGLVGTCNGIIKDSHNIAKVLDGKFTGGLAGLADNGTISDSYNIGDISGLYAGGLTGYIDNGELIIVNSYNTGEINGTNVAGGLNAYNVDGHISITDSHNTGSVTSTIYSGGLLGYTKESGTLHITGSYNTGNIRASRYVSNLTAELAAGGLVGCTKQGASAEIKNSYNEGSVTCRNESSSYRNLCYAGGLAGYLGSENSIDNCHNKGNVWGTKIAGGLVGQGIVSITKSYNTGTIKGGIMAGGLGACFITPEINFARLKSHDI